MWLCFVIVPPIQGAKEIACFWNCFLFPIRVKTTEMQACFTVQSKVDTEENPEIGDIEKKKYI